VVWQETDFYLGTHRPSWLPLTDVPLFVSDVTLRGRRTTPKAKGRWAKDSGGFSQLQAHGAWTGSDAEYAIGTLRQADQAERMPDFAACRDMMCEPFMLEKTGLTIRDHQMWTIESYCNLVALAPSVPWLPVVQGWQTDDYRSHVEMYADAGVDLRELARVGVGSVCRRQATKEGAGIILAVAELGIRVHAFGVKVEGLKLFGNSIASADSMAWSFIARRRGMLLEACQGQNHKNCANCFRWAIEWHRTRIQKLPPTTREICSKIRGVR
jgi:hypothetical protein